MPYRAIEQEAPTSKSVRFKWWEYVTFAKVGRSFKLIDEDTKTIFVNIEDEAQEILQELKNKGFTKAGMRRAGQYCVNVYKEEFEKYESAGMLQLISGDIQDFYELKDLEQYSEDVGLNLEIDYGMAVCW